MGEFTLKGFICERCGHKWVPREDAWVPRVCPKCKSPYWDRPRGLNPRTEIAKKLDKISKERMK